MYRLLSMMQSEALRLVAEIESRGLAPAAGAPSTAAWLTATTRMRLGEARAQVDLATALGSHPGTRAALASGVVSVEHARQIMQVLDQLPATTGPETMAAVEGELVGWAVEHTPTVLARLGRRLLTTLTPDPAEPDLRDPERGGVSLNTRIQADGWCEGEFGSTRSPPCSSPP